MGSYESGGDFNVPMRWRFDENGKPTASAGVTSVILNGQEMYSKQIAIMFK